MLISNKIEKVARQKKFNIVWFAISALKALDQFYLEHTNLLYSNTCKSFISTLICYQSGSEYLCDTVPVDIVNKNF